VCSSDLREADYKEFESSGKNELEYFPNEHKVLDSIMPSYLTGYINSAFAKVARIFDLHPVVHLKNSRMHASEILVGRFEKLRYRFAKRIAKRHSQVGIGDVFVSHVAIPAKELEIVRNELNKSASINQVFINKASFSAACSTGIGSLCISYVKKLPKGMQNEFDQMIDEIKGE